jgi:hypothetical protein
MASKTSKGSTREGGKGATKHGAAKKSTQREGSPKPRGRRIAKPVLLAGGNPQVAKADGDAPVRAYLAAMPGWKREVGQRLDALIERMVPNVRKAVRWNSPFYGVEGRGWFLGLHCLTKYVKVAFYRGTELDPVPPVESKKEGIRYVHLHEHEPLDEALLTRWIRQAAKLPGMEWF